MRVTMTITLNEPDTRKLFERYAEHGVQPLIGQNLADWL